MNFYNAEASKPEGVQVATLNASERNDANMRYMLPLQRQEKCTQKKHQKYIFDCHIGIPAPKAGENWPR